MSAYKQKKGACLMDMQKVTVNGKDWKGLSKELSKGIKATNILEYASKVEKRILDVLGANYSLETEVRFDNGNYLARTSLKVFSDANELINTRDGYSCSADCSNASLLSIADAANRYGVPVFTLENAKKAECQLPVETAVEKVEEEKKKPTENAGSVEENTDAEDTEYAEELNSTENADATDGETSTEELPATVGNASEPLEFEIVSDWARTKQNQFWCSVYLCKNGDVDKSTKYILVIGEDAQKVLFARISSEPEKKMNAISAHIYGVLRNKYVAGKHFRCFAELRKNREYVMIDLPN